MYNKKLLPVLKEARNLIENNGWGQHEYCKGAKSGHTKLLYKNNYDEPVCYCLYGAILKAEWNLYSDKDETRVFSVDGELHRECNDVIRNKLSESIVHWNDSDKRTKEDVLNMFNNVISDLDKQSGTV